MSQRERQLMAAIGQLANGEDYETVMGACANMILNGLRQQNATIEQAEAKLDDLIEEMRGRLRKDHYDSAGQRNERRIVIPPLKELIPG